MRSFTATEIGALVLSAFFVVGGVGFVIHPVETYVLHPNDDGGVRGDIFSAATYEHVSRKRSRAYGALSVILGASIAGLVLYRQRGSR